MEILIKNKQIENGNLISIPRGEYLDFESKLRFMNVLAVQEAEVYKPLIFFWRPMEESVKRIEHFESLKDIGKNNEGLKRSRQTVFGHIVDSFLNPLTLCFCLLLNKEMMKISNSEIEFLGFEEYHKYRWLTTLNPDLSRDYLNLSQFIRHMYRMNL